MEELMIKTQPLTAYKIEWNKEELTQMVDTIVEQYKGLVYTDEQIPEAKKDAARLNKAKEAIEDERKRIKKICESPYKEFEKEIKPLVEKIDSVRAEITTQTAAYEASKKAKKKQDLLDFYKTSIGTLEQMVPFERLFDEKWLNATVTFDKATMEMTEKILKINSELRAIDSIDTEFVTACKDYYLRTFDLPGALEKSKELYNLKKQEEERKAAQEAAAAAIAPPVEEVPAEAPPAATTEKLEMTFTVYGTLQELIDLKTYMDSVGLEYK